MTKIFSKYLEKQALFTNLIKEKPNVDTKLIVIIPAYNEPDILNTLNSLTNCTTTKFPSEIIVVLNHAENALPEIIKTNKETLVRINDWACKNSSEHLRYHAVLVENLPKKHAGAGLARKIAMDLAIERFQTINEENGIIASLDADTLISENYLVEIQKAFVQNKKIQATTFYFEHIPNHDSEINQAIETYELYLRFFKQALHFTGFPYAFHTIGSCFAVRASAYVKQGGMNRRQGGEDFYFLHKIFPLGFCKELNQIKVFPSSRPSDRVPFGTGPAIRNIMNTGDYPTYQPIYFEHLKNFFLKKDELYKAQPEHLSTFYEKLDMSLQSFIPSNEFIGRLVEISSNCASHESFEKRFFHWFDAFKIIKYLNFIHEDSTRISTKQAAILFLNKYLRIDEHSDETHEILKIYRNLEKGNIK